MTLVEFRKSTRSGEEGEACGGNCVEIGVVMR